ncbi:uncharacterized protein LOC62_05G007143 [Vanrija pseudolonga]|uniref:Uncharacterized protein n=1 Tax=Vanrija pseudolonga TaxID=143232 RepID=A0AAF1BSK5_9TREE|nr:hypothetical protein LOC62_05G007143 [Vanrija pseudolonga]
MTDDHSALAPLALALLPLLSSSAELTPSRAATALAALLSVGSLAEMLHAPEAALDAFRSWVASSLTAYIY